MSTLGNAVDAYIVEPGVFSLKYAAQTINLVPSKIAIPSDKYGLKRLLPFFPGARSDFRSRPTSTATSHHTSYMINFVVSDLRRLRCIRGRIAFMLALPNAHQPNLNAADKGHLEVVKALLVGGAKADVLDHDSWSPRQVSENNARFISLEQTHHAVEFFWREYVPRRPAKGRTRFGCIFLAGTLRNKLDEEAFARRRAPGISKIRPCVLRL